MTSANTLKTGGQIASLTSARFFAALAVALSHFTALGFLHLPAFFLKFVDGGRSAVTFFFVLSGFVLAYNYYEPATRLNTSRFYLARFARVYPVLLLSLLLSATVTAYVVAGHHDNLMAQWYAIKDHKWLSLGASLLAQLLLLTGWFPLAAINQPWNGPAWSISCEAFFYAVFPSLLMRFGATSNRRMLMTCLAAWCLQGAWILAVIRFLPANRAGFVVYQFPLTHFPEFMMGVGAALYYLRAKAIGESLHRRGIALIAGALIVLACIAVSGLPMPAFFFEAPVFTALILGLAQLERPVLGVLNRRPLVLLGEASFSLYLIHVPLAHWAQIAGLPGRNGWIALVFAIVMSIVVFTRFEQPMRRRILRGIRTVRLEPAGRARVATDA
ncbi:acyltransferase [Trinickia dabaoshanensis]|uniref:Acyltransferase n=1 Tax=Trinickia dabaoshanensis TaxID=564714 RepID=A0A2N7VVS9_9BURK|nr:acyltransferase [Trinickia dabaoshanensis]PMS21251.1 acyltransferase [Trinickia dabaoshanensis]